MKQLAALFPQQLGAGEIDFSDQRLAGKRDITDRSKIVQIHITIPGLLQRNPCLAQGFVLHLQFNLVHLELVGRMYHRIIRRCVTGLCSSVERSSCGTCSVGFLRIVLPSNQLH